MPTEWEKLSVDERVAAVEALSAQSNWRVFSSRLRDDAPEVRLAVLKAITNQGTPARNALLLRDPCREVQEASIILLVLALRSRSVTPESFSDTGGLLNTALRCGDEALRVSAAEALRRIGSTELGSAESLLENYVADPVVAVRANAALAMVSQPRGLRLLLDVLPDVRASGDHQLVEDIVSTMALYHDDPAAQNLLQSAIDGSDPDLKRVAWETLRSIRSEWATDVLITSSDPYVRYSTLRELRDRKWKIKEQALGRRCYELRLQFERRQPQPAAGSQEALYCRSTSNIDYVPKKRTSRVANFSFVSPSTLAQGQTAVLSLWVHAPDEADEVFRLAQRAFAGQELLVYTKGGVNVGIGADMTVKLEVPGLTVSDPEDSFVWIDEIANVSFPVSVPSDAATGSYPGVARIRLQGMQIAKLHIVLTVAKTTGTVQPLAFHEERTRRAFASYASADRAEVLGRIQGMQKACPWLDVFVDVANLRSGERWRNRLVEEIKARDVLYLFWSAAAKESPWVEMEWRTALEQRGIEFIDPVPLVPPHEVAPPKELADTLHFNDWVLAFLRAETSTRQP